MNKRSISVNRDSSTPLYEQLANSICTLINKGDYAGGEKLPTEDELISLCGVSRQVVRQAYDLLVSKGFVVRQRGKGTFVRARNYGVFLNGLRSYSEELSISGQTPYTKVIAFDTVDISNMEMAGRELPAGTYLRLVRLRFADKKPTVLITTYLSKEDFSSLLEVDFSKLSLYKTLNENYGLIPTTSHRRLKAMNAGHACARYLGLSESDAILAMESMTYDQNGKLLESSIERFGSEPCYYDFIVHR